MSLRSLAVCLVLSSPAVHAAAVDPLTGEVRYPDTSGVDTSDETTSGGTEVSPDPSPGLTVVYTDVCEDYLSTDWEVLLQAGVDATMVDQVSTVDVFELKSLGFKVTASYWLDAADVSFECTEMVGVYLDTCIENAEDDYARCIGWTADGGKPGAGTDWKGCLDARNAAIDECEDTYVDHVGIDFGKSTVTLEADLSLSINTTLGRIRTYSGSMVLSGRLYEKRINPDGANTVQFCLSQIDLVDIDFPILEGVVGDAVSDALGDEICFGL